MFNLPSERDATSFALVIFAFGAAAAGIPAAPDPIDLATIIPALNAAVSTISADACSATPECAGGGPPKIVTPLYLDSSQHDLASGTTIWACKNIRVAEASSASSRHWQCPQGAKR